MTIALDNVGTTKPIAFALELAMHHSRIHQSVKMCLGLNFFSVDVAIGYTARQAKDKVDPAQPLPNSPTESVGHRYLILLPLSFLRQAVK